MADQDAIIATGGAIGGAIVTKLLGLVFGRSERILREAEAMRGELRADIAKAQAREDELRLNVERWMKLYYEEKEARVRCDDAREAFREEVDELRAKVERLEARLAAMGGGAK